MSQTLISSGRPKQPKDFGKLSGTSREQQRLVRPERQSPPVAILRGSCGSDSVQIHGAVDGHPTSFVVDSGANRTIISKDVLSRPHMHTIPNGLADVTGRRTDLYGPEDVCLRINGRDYRQTVFICKRAQ